MAKLEFDVTGPSRALESIVTEIVSAFPEILEKQAAAVEAAQKREAQSRLSGPYSTGATAASIKAGKVKRSGYGYSVTVGPAGTRPDGNRAAEIAFINEFGKRGQPARPFIRLANEKVRPELDEIAEKALDRAISD